jgi:hypothetical protein
LASELPELADILVVEGLDISITGFAPVEIGQIAADFEEDPSKWKPVEQHQHCTLTLGDSLS